MASTSGVYFELCYCGRLLGRSPHSIPFCCQSEPQPALAEYSLLNDRCIYPVSHQLTGGVSRLASVNHPVRMHAHCCEHLPFIDLVLRKSCRLTLPGGF